MSSRRKRYFTFVVFYDASIATKTCFEVVVSFASIDIRINRGVAQGWSPSVGSVAIAWKLRHLTVH